MNESVLERRRRVTVVGVGVIGLSWTAVFLDHGLEVTVNDPAPDAERRVRAGVADILGSGAWGDRLHFEPDLAAAVRDADLVQENGPDREQFKQELWARIESATGPATLLLSSSSGITASRQGKQMRDPGRLLIGHPFNPPHIIPLVEVVPANDASPAPIQEAMAFYRAVGKHPVLLNKEVPGFVANRLQAVLMRECIWLVNSGVVTPRELDEIVTHSLGPRWATDGPFTSFTMGGGPGGFTHFLDHFSRGLQLLWLHSSLQPVVLVAPWVKKKLLRKVEAEISQDVPALEARRDPRLRAVLDTLGTSGGE